MDVAEIEYHKMILSKVSFDGELFEKELFKALSSMLPKHRPAFMEWCHVKYSRMHYRVIRKFLPKKVRRAFAYVGL